MSEHSSAFQIIKGEALFFGSFIIMVLVTMIIDPILDVGNLIFPDSDLTGIIWFFLLILFVIMVVIVPIVYMIKGMQNLDPADKMKNLFVAVFLGLTNILLTIYGWHIVTGVMSIAPDTFFVALFWIGFTFVWLTATIIAPTYIIMRAFT